ncbi:MAG TPA: hypothetical protein VMA74_15385 [Dyella sp.]|uniref:hypothetical protein n=1 Tax=Dyella sp. TaxID=1869338 RepID=UPI002CB90F10|nr:hypothetical protein [Dyella sp.]HUB91106.1 hypothetical protein [Dyella sp.]
MRKLIVALAVLMPAFMMMGCTPTVAYRAYNNTGTPGATTDVSDPAAGDIVFALPSPDVILTKVAKAGDAGAIAMTQRNEVCASAASSPASPSTVDANAAATCLGTLQLGVSPHVDVSDIYVATPSEGTSISVSPLAANPLLPMKVAQSYQNPVTKRLSTALTGAAAGYAVGGPVGAVVVAIGAEATAQSYRGSNAARLCAGNEAAGGSLTLTVPISLDLKAYLPTPPAASSDTQVPALDETICWTAIPKTAGWYYRALLKMVVTDQADRDDLLQLPPVVMGGQPLPPNYHWKEPFLSSPAAANRWPTSACLAMKLEIAWLDKTDNSGAIDPTVIGTYDLIVPDPNIVQTVAITKQPRTIVLGSTCGEYATTGTPSQADTSLTDLIKEAQALKQATEGKTNSGGGGGGSQK